MPGNPLNIKITCETSSQGLSRVHLETLDSGGAILRVIGPLAHELQPKIRAWLKAYLEGHSPPHHLPLDLSGLPPFTQRVLEHLSKIPFGQAQSYQEVAKICGNAKACRAVGNACGRNPVPLFIPCHRILAGNQQLGGFSIGLPLKRQLLDFEGISYRESI